MIWLFGLVRSKLAAIPTKSGVMIDPVLGSVIAPVESRVSRVALTIPPMLVPPVPDRR